MFSPLYRAVFGPVRRAERHSASCLDAFPGGRQMVARQQGLNFASISLVLEHTLQHKATSEGKKTARPAGFELPYIIP